MSKLSYSQRKRLSKKDFIYPSRAPGSGSYPIPDKKHAKNALSRVSQYGSPSEKARVRAAVYKKYPSLRKGK